MKYCIKCGNKLKEETNFCSKCGYPTQTGLLKIEKERITEKEKMKEKSLLYLGASLIIISSLIFAFASWEEMSNLFRVLFLTFEMLIFLSLSIFSKKFENSLPYKTFWFIGLLFFPIIIELIADYSLFGNYLSYNGAGIYVYLSISFIICSIINVFSYKLLNEKVFLYTSYTYIYITIINILYLVGLHNINFEKINGVQIVLSFINLFIIIVSNYIDKKLLKKSLNTFMSIILFIFSLNLLVKLSEYNIYSKVLNMNDILVIAQVISTLACLLILMKKDNKSTLSNTYPILLISLISVNLILLIDNINVAVFLITLSSILIYFISCLYNIKSYRIISYILFILTTYILISNISYKMIIIITLLQTITLIMASKINKGKTEEFMCNLLIPINIAILISSILNIVNIYKVSALFLIASIICFTISIILDIKLKKKFIKISLEIFSYLYLFISSITILFSDASIIIFIMNELSWVYYFMYKNVRSKNKIINILLFIILLLNLLICPFKFNTPLYYILLFVSLVNISIYLISLKFKNINIKGYFYASYIISIIASLFDLNKYNLLFVCMNVLVYALIYIVSVKYIKINFILKYVYTLIGFLLIFDLFNYFINTKEIAYMLILISYIIIIISMFLLQIDSDRKVLSYTPVVALPYLKLVYSVDVFKDIKLELIVLLLVVLILLLFEKVFKFKKENDKVLIELLLLGLISLFTMWYMIIFNFILSIFYIFFGLYKKKDAFVIYGIVLLIISIIINLYNIIDDLAITYILLLLGIILVVYVFYKETKRNKKK